MSILILIAFWITVESVWALFDLRNAPMGSKAPIFSDPLLCRTWPLIRAFDKVKSQVRAVRPRVSEIILYWICDRFYQMWNTFSVHFGYMFRSNLSFWVHLPPSGEVLGGQEPKGFLNPWFWGPLGLPLGSLSHENASPFLIKKLVEFVADLCMHFDSQNGPKCVLQWTNIESNFNFCSSSFSYRFFSGFWEAFSLFSDVAHLRFVLFTALS